MSDQDYTVQGYLPTIGIECHVQLKTKTKLFAGVGNDARGAKPNTLISHICLGMPGALPVLNQKAVEYAVRAALAFHVKPQNYSYFERKHYFYPDLPKGYQITQLAHPIVVGGHVVIEPHGKPRKVALNRVQMEEDAGKNTHPAGADYSLVDLNRAGTPLLEIVSEPDIHSSLEAKLYAKELHALMRYADVSDADMYHGNMRFDVNVSVSKAANELGTRTETKNLNSFKSVEKTTEYEIKRQIELLEKGEVIIQETRGWDDAKQRTVSQRSKEEAHDYRYFPEPDLPPIMLDDDFVNRIEAEMPVMPDKIRSFLDTLGLDISAIETLIDTKRVALFVYGLKAEPVQTTKRIANWLASDVQGWMNEGEWSWDDVLLDQQSFLQLVKLVQEKQISSTGAKQVLKVMLKDGGDPLKIAKERDVLQVSDEGEIQMLVARILEANPKAAEDVRAGEGKAIGFLVGQIMKESRGKANPALAQDLIKNNWGYSMSNIKPVRKAVIAAAGLGTRFLPQTKAMPKEMLPIIDKPVIQMVVEEAVAAGVTDIMIVTGSTKRSIEDHFDRAAELEEALIQKGKTEEAKQIRDIAELANFIYIRQKGEPSGNARPVLNCSHLIDDEPFFVFFADDFFRAEVPRAKQLLEAYEQTGKSVISAIQVPRKDASKYGMIELGEQVSEGIHVVKRLVEKPGEQNAPSDIASVGGYLLTPDIMPILAKETVSARGEIELSEAINVLAQTDSVYCKQIQGRFHDTGSKLTYMEALIDTGLANPKFGPSLRRYLEERLKEE